MFAGLATGGIPARGADRSATVLATGHIGAGGRDDRVGEALGAVHEPDADGVGRAVEPDEVGIAVGVEVAGADEFPAAGTRSRLVGWLE